MSNSISSKNALLKSANNLHLHLYHFARGFYPGATGIPAALPVNRCLMVLDRDVDDISYISDKNDRFALQACRVYFIPAHHTAAVKLTEKLRFISIQESFQPVVALNPIFTPIIISLIIASNNTNKEKFKTTSENINPTPNAERITIKNDFAESNAFVRSTLYIADGVANSLSEELYERMKFG